MKTAALGKTGIEVSPMCLGLMYYGTRVGKDTSYRLMDRFLEAGGNFVDTANIYSHWVSGFKGGESESLLGEWMRERQNRQSLLIASKVGFGYPGVEGGLKADQIQAECEKSLHRLGTDTIDLYYAHVDDRVTPLEETLEAFERLVKAGKVRYLGASNYLAWRLAQAAAVSQAHGWTQFCCIQQRHTYLRPRHGASFGPQVSANNDLLDYVRSAGISLLAYASLLGGAYTRPESSLPEQYRSPESEARLSNLDAVAREANATPNQVILAWMLQGDPPFIPVMAASSDAQMDENLDSLKIGLSPEQLSRLNA